jgi:hypothetical protein
MEGNTKIQAVLLKMDPVSESTFRDQLGDFYLREKNLRKKVELHLSLTICALPNDRISQMISCLAKVKDELFPVLISLGQPEPLGDDYIAIQVPLYGIKNLKDFHNKLLDLIQPVTREAFNPKYLDSNLTEHELEYLHKYGYHRIKEYYHPHITIGKYENATTRDQEFKMVPKLKGEFLFNKLQLDQSIDGSGIPADILWESVLNNKTQVQLNADG